jgi:hypothetical protein
VADAVLINLNLLFGATGLDLPLIYIIISFPITLAFCIILAWFHLETLRIAYWMFATASLPRINLLNKAIVNFMLVILYVSMLTAIGSAATGICGLFLGAVETSLMSATGQYSGDFFGNHLAWAFASMIGLMSVGFLKRHITHLYELEFWRNYLLYTWWGAAETSHPQTYPLGMMQLTMPWVYFLKGEEQELASNKSAPRINHPGRP